MVHKETLMRPAFEACLLMAGFCAAFAAPATAGMKLDFQTKTYPISGRTGTELVEAMNREGPKRGFMAHAIAQTSYTVDWELKVTEASGICRLADATGTLNLTYTFPSVASHLSPALNRRWKRFYAGVRAHEREHGRMAKAMVRATEKSIIGLTRENDRFCIKTRHAAKRRIRDVYNQYEARQVAFDKREHSDGGRVERLVEALMGKH
jgi:predicted secreted Zn-dependent protease